ncbi:uncharacterized protein LOC133200859 [Saccostrea echinata]|uniref:uncharacterized protein LOC133200859 n=1 Tax=Saccostrea echinata TaxID=191078 RepID=UPI002A7FDE93|nr:uncharacterized protein LOC133200859 [Saccostrea echinata]
MDAHLLIFSVFLLGAKGLLINRNQTHQPSVSERLDALEKQLAEEKRQRYLLQIKYDQEIEQMNSTDQKLLQVYKRAPKQFQDISIQIKGALLSINNLDNRHSLEIQEVLGKLREVQTSLSDLASNQSDIINLQRHFQEKENVYNSMIDTLKRNETSNNEKLTKLQSSLTSLANTVRTLESTVNANTNKQTILQTQLQGITNPIVFLAAPLKPVSWWFNVPSVFENTAVKFPSVKINVGGGYNSNTGVFTSSLHHRIIVLLRHRPKSRWHDGATVN